MPNSISKGLYFLSYQESRISAQRDVPGNCTSRRSGGHSPMLGPPLTRSLRSIELGRPVALPPHCPNDY